MNRGTASIDVTAVNPFAEGNQNVAVSLEARPHTENKEYVYDFGIRRRSEKEVSRMADARQFNQPKNVTVTLRLPLGYCQVVNYVVIRVNQSSEEHDCKIISGGIGQSHIELLITAKNTEWFNYNANFYGKRRLC